MKHRSDDISPHRPSRPLVDVESHPNPSSQQTGLGGENDALLGAPIEPVSSILVEDSSKVPNSSDDISPSTTLHRSSYVLLMALLYVGLAIFSWVVTCILAFRPITAKHYGAWIWNADNNGYGWSSPKRIHSLYVKNENWYRTARVMQAIVGVLTLPLTSAV
jgi:hypothetical protein